MHAQALVCDAQQQFSLADVFLPEPDADSLVVRTLCSGVSIGTEFALIRNKISWGPYPLCTGYQAVGVVESAGRSVEGFRPGDKVYYRDNQKFQLTDGTAVSAVSGTHASHAVISLKTTGGVAKLPAGVDDDAASLFVMPAVGLWGVDMSNPRLGETVLVYGAGLIGLGVVAACARRGCRVIAVDLDDRRLALAEKLGADHVLNSRTQDVQAEVLKLAPQLPDTVFEATGIPACLDSAIALCRKGGKFIWQGNYGKDPVALHFLPPHGKQLQMFFPCDDGLAPCRRAVLKNMAAGALDWAATITHRIPAAASAAFYDRINRGQASDVLGAVIRWCE